MKKRLYSILARIIGILLIVFLAFVFVLQIPAVQSRLARGIVGILSEKMDAEISFNTLQIVPGSGLLITDLLIKDRNPYTEDRYERGWESVDTLVSAQSLKVRFSLRGLISGKPFRLRSVQLDNASFALVTEPDGEYQNNLSRIFKLKPTVKEPGPDAIFHVKNVEVNNFRFRLVNFGPQKTPTPEMGFNWDDLDLIANLEGHDLHYTDGRMYGICDHADLTEKGGYRLKNLSGRAVVGRGQTRLDHLTLVDDWSDLSLQKLNLKYTDSKAFASFTDSVSIEGAFNPSVFGFPTLQYFSGKRSENGLSFKIAQGEVNGPVAALDIRDLRFVEQKSSVSADISRLELNNLPDLQNLWMDADIRNLKAESEGAGIAISNFSGKKTSLPKGIRADLNLLAKGPANDLKADLSGSTNYGELKAALSIKNLLDPETDMNIDGSLAAGNIGLGALLKSKELGQAELRTHVNATLGKQLNADLDSLRISRLEFKGYSYRDITGKAHYGADGLSASITSDDPNLKLQADARSQGEGYLLDARIDKLNLDALGIAPGLEIKDINGNLSADLNSATKELLAGTATLSDLNFVKKDGQKQTLKNLTVNAAKDSTGIDVKLASLPVNGNLRGKSPEDFNLALDLHDRTRLLDFFVPGLYVSDRTSVKAMRKPDGTVDMSVRSPLLSFGENSVQNANVTLRNKGEQIELQVRSNAISLGETLLNRPTVNIVGDYSIDGKDFTLHTQADSSYLKINSQTWRMSSASLSLKDKRLSIDGFALCGPSDQYLCADGGFSKESADTLNVRLKDFDCASIDAILSKEFNIKGIVNGTATIYSPTGDGLKLDAALKTGNIVVSGAEAGMLDITASMDGPQVQAVVNNSLNGKTLLNLNADLNTKSKAIFANADVDHFNLALASPFLEEVFSEVGGYLNGKVGASGSLDNLDIAGDSLSLDDARLRLKVTDVLYNLNGRLKLTGEGLEAPAIRITDDESGHAVLNATLKFNKFKKPEVAANMIFTDLKLLGKEDRGDGFYGKAYASGSVKVNGPLKSMLIEANAITAKEGSVHVPVGSALAGESKILTFRTRKDLLHSLRNRFQNIDKEEETVESGRSGIKIKANVSVRENTQAMVEIDKSQGHAISVKGTGNVTLDIRPTESVVDLGGVYNITNGKYHFAALSNLAVKDFSIQPGSSIKFNGKPKDSEFDITALYSKKASIAPLLTDSTSVQGLRLVNCGLKIGNKISNPDLQFSIDIPDLDPSTKTQVDGALNTDDKIQKQFVALVLTGSFIPADESGITFNGSNALYSNLSSIMSGQLNNILQTLNIPLDMGLNYQQTSSGKDMFDVAVSTQLFNNRVLVNGSVGSRKNSGSSNTDVVGDIDIEVKLNKSGQLRLKMFSHSADGYTSYLDNSQRNGIGLSYQREYSSFKRFIQSIFRRRRYREAILNDRMRRERKMKTIKIEKNEKALPDTNHSRR